MITIDGFEELVDLYNSVVADSAIEQQEIVINTRKETLQTFLEILKSVQEKNTEYSFTVNSLVTKRLLYKLGNRLNHATPQKNSIDISLTQNDWKNLSNILITHMLVVKPNRKDWSDWLSQTIVRIAKETGIE